MRLEAPRRKCLGPGCNALVSGGRCAACSAKHQRTTDRARGSSWRRGYDDDWRRLRQMFVRANPLCQDCREAGRITAAEEVHHVIPIEDRPDLRLVWENLRALCKPCHSAITAASGRKQY